MDEQARVLLQRILRRVPSKKTQSLLRAWGCLSAEQLEDVDYTRTKWLLVENIISKCEESRLRLKDVTKLELVYHIENPNQGTWHSFKLTEAEDEALSVDFIQFKEMFTAHLEEVVRHVSVRIKKAEDGAVWIRIAWGDNFTKPNHLKPTYAVHYLQTPYVFILHLNAKHKPFLYQALVLSTRHVSINEAHLSGRSLAALRDLLMKQYQQIPISIKSTPSLLRENITWPVRLSVTGRCQNLKPPCTSLKPGTEAAAAATTHSVIEVSSSEVWSSSPAPTSWRLYVTAYPLALLKAPSLLSYPPSHRKEGTTL
ncbi:centromere protein N isoform X2 [Neoarius graeffei]|uniref:centromere protein N isoform X2 n=1 Tax=Neoarius graeffei TaxID=443677 RepID=UPI00298BE326|nr:centromere protein N isoform X2 [Neoarius graeffei]